MLTTVIRRQMTISKATLALLLTTFVFSSYGLAATEDILPPPVGQYVDILPFGQAKSSHPWKAVGARRGYEWTCVDE